MPDRIKKAAKALSERGGICMFIRAQFSSQIASATDFMVTILLAKVFSLYYVYDSIPVGRIRLELQHATHLCIQELRYKVFS